MFHSVLELVEDLKQGKMILLVDDEGRENEGDLVLAGQFASPESINFMVKEARGLVCLAMSEEQSDRLGLSLMVGEEANKTPNKTAFTVSIEAREGITTGISAADRAHTIRVASNPEATPQSILTPGHIFPIKAKAGGVIQRAGHTEGSVDLMKLGGLDPSAVICEVMNDDGTMARLPELKEFAKKHEIKIGSIEDLIGYRLKAESHVEFLYQEDFSDSSLQKPLSIRYFKNRVNNQIHYAVISGTLTKGAKGVPVRVHVDRGPEDLLANQNTQALKNFLAHYQKIDSPAVLLVLRHANYFSVPDAKKDEKEYGLGAQILNELGVDDIMLATNSQPDDSFLSAFGVHIKDTISFSQFQEAR